MSQPTLRSATRALDRQLVAVLQGLQAGQRIRITQRVRVGQQQWTTTVLGTFRDINYLATGLATHRVPSDDVVVVTVHFTKENGELSSVTMDEHSKVEAI